MTKVEDEFPNIINLNGLSLENVTVKSITDDKYLEPDKLVTYAEFAQGYIVNNLAEYGGQPQLKEPEYIHTPEQSFLILSFKGKENYSYQAILKREGRKEGVDIESYFLMRDESGMILRLHRVKDDVVAMEEDDPRDSRLYEDVTDILDYINSVKQEDE